MTIYLIGPINGCTDAEANDWRSEAKRICEARGHKWLDPMARDYRGKEDDSVDDIVHGDKRDIKQCGEEGGGCLRYLSKPSEGSAQETIYSWERGIPVSVANPEGHRVSPWLRYHVIAISKTIEGAIIALENTKWPIRRINTYRYSFRSNCLINGLPIDYSLEIETDGPAIMVEDIKNEVGDADNLHEPLADRLHKRFGGHQTLRANHHGVDIETVRG